MHHTKFLVLIGFVLLCTIALSYGKTKQLKVTNCDMCVKKCGELAKEHRSKSVSQKCVQKNSDVDCKCTYSGAPSLMNWGIVSLLTITAGAIQFH